MGDPELLDGVDERRVLVRVVGLVQVGVRVEVVRAEDVAVRLRGGEHDDRDMAQLGVLLDLGEDLAAVLAREIEVEKDQIDLGDFRMGAPAPHEVHGLDAVAREVDVHADAGAVERLLRHARVPLVVLDVQELKVTDRRGGLPPSQPGM